MLKDLGRRSFVSFISVAVLSSLLIFANYFPVMVSTLIVGAMIAGVCLWEYNELAAIKGAQIGKFLPVFAAILAIFVGLGPSGFAAFLFFVFLIVLFLSHFKQIKGAIVDLAVSSFGLIYIAVPIGMMLAILYRGPDDGRVWLAYLIIVTKISDIGAYFIGSLFGKQKFFASISPSKTVEGALAGLVCSLGASYLFYQIGWLGSLEWILLGFPLGVIAQASDLAESLLKRDAHKKDSNALPGLGGALDAVDSLLLNAPILYFYLNL